MFHVVEVVWRGIQNLFCYTQTIIGPNFLSLGRALNFARTWAELCPDNTVAQKLLVVEMCRTDPHMFTLFRQNGTQKSQYILLRT